VNWDGDAPARRGRIRLRSHTANEGARAALTVPQGCDPHPADGRTVDGVEGMVRRGEIRPPESRPGHGTRIGQADSSVLEVGPPKSGTRFGDRLK
jgi:hypothetical protein